MRLELFIEQLKPRVQRLGLVDPQTGYYDVDEVSYYAQEAVRFLANCYQLQQFLRIDRELFRTSDGVESYALPANYGILAPLETRRSGFSVREVETDEQEIYSANLEYYDLAKYNLYRSNTTGKPYYFTLADSLMYLQPVPDGVYIIEGIIRPLQDGVDIPDAYVAAVATETLWRMAADMGKSLPALLDDRVKLLKTLVNNESRTRQKFYSSTERLGFGRHRRWR